jgi:hypothetical protein
MEKSSPRLEGGEGVTLETQGICVKLSEFSDFAEPK